MQRTLLNSIIKATHSQTRIKLYRVKRSPCFKRSVVKTRTFFLLSIVIFTSIERSQSPLTESLLFHCHVLKFNECFIASLNQSGEGKLKK